MKTLRHQVFLKLITSAVLILCFTILIGGFVAARNFEKVLTLWGENLQMIVYLDSEIEPTRITEIQKQIENFIGIEKVEFVTKEKSIESLKTQMASYAPDLLSDPELTELVPSHLQVKLDASDPSQNLSRLHNLSEKLKSEKGVAEVSYGQEWVKKYTQFNELVRGLVGFLSLTLLGACLFIIATVIQNSIESRRYEIEVLELLGATPARIRKPFLLEGAILGFVSMALALIFVGTAFGYVVNHFSGPLSFLKISGEMTFLASQQILIFLILGPTLGGVVAWLCVSKMSNQFNLARTKS